MTNNTGTTVVLGWDGLDAQLLEEWDLWDAFGDHGKQIETYSNPVIGKPHTREIWPTMITGVGPDGHGIKAATEGEGVKWSNPAIGMAARVAQHTIPDGLRSAIGRKLRSRGAEVERYSADYYEERGLETVFDGRQSLPIAVPNYWTDLDDRMGFMFDRGAELSKFLERDASGWRPADADQQLAVEQEMLGEAGTKAGLVRSALDREYDLVWAWFGAVDTAGHVEPVADDPFQRRAYEHAATWTREIRDALGPDDTLVCLSDHGLRGGEHTDDAVVASNDAGVVRRIESVFDVRETIDDLTPRHSGGTVPELETDISMGRAGERETAASVRQNLEDLGYVEG